MTKLTRKPSAVLISDIHFSPANLELASAALRAAQIKARELSVPMVVAGDLTDTKAIIRGEVANRLIEIFKEGYDLFQIVTTGNHDVISEKGSAHSLNFLKPYTRVIDTPVRVTHLTAFLIPYCNTPEAVRASLVEARNTNTKLLIMHQGVMGADMGAYVKDSTSIPKDEFSDFRVISGHYHKAQDIQCGRPRKGAVGLFSYIGNPYTLSFAEANDGPKGFRVLYDDGLMDLIPLNLRKHVIIDLDVDKLGDTDADGNYPFQQPNKGDLVWLKLRGPFSQLEAIKKSEIGEYLGLSNFKFDKIYTDSAKLDVQADKFTGEQLMDKLVNGLKDESQEHKDALKRLWRDIIT